MTARLLRSAVVLYLAASLAAGSPVFGQSQGQDQPQAQSQPQTQSQPPAEAQVQSQPSPPPQDQSRNFAAQPGPDYSKGKRAFPTILAPYMAYHVPEPVLTNSPRIDQLIHDGKLMLSLQDAVSLALENNLDITVQRYVPWIAETDILRTKAGGAPRGAGGFGTATVLGAIPQTSYDPVVTANYSWSRAHFPVNNPLTSGTGILPKLGNQTNYNEQANFQYTQGFHTGTAIAYAIDNTRTSSTTQFAFFNPAVQSTQILQIQQQLLNGFGLLPNTRFILEAKNNMVVANAAFALQVITTVTAVEDLYWEVVFTRENVKVQEAAVATSQKLYEDNKKQVEIGTLAPIEVVRAESEVAADRQNLIVAQTNSLQQQTLLLNAIAKNPLAPELLNVEVVPTDAIPDTSSAQMLPLQDAVKVAWEKRLELRQQEYTLKNDDIEVKTTRNALLPTLTAFGQVSSTGLSGVNRTNPGMTPPMFKRTGLGDALDTAYSTDFPQYSAGVNFTLPVRNRSAQADNARALLTHRQDETIYKRLQNSIMVDVRNTEIALQQNMARVEAAQKARVLAQQTLDAERKKYQLGASTVFFVIQAQRDLTTAQGNELRAKADLQEAEVGYYRSLGRTLEVNNIAVADARSGHVYHPTLIPGTPSAQLSLTNEGGK